MLSNSADLERERPSHGKLGAAFLLLWVPYVAGTGLQERFGVDGPAGPLLITASLLLAWPVSRSLREPYGDEKFGLRWHASTPLVLAGGLSLMALARLLAALMAQAAGLGTIQAAPASELLSAFGLALAIGVVPALAEDILTRGFPLFAARSRLAPSGLILISAAIYTLNHLWRLDWGLTEQVRLFCMGLAYAAAASRLRSLWAAFALHLGWNAGSALVPLDITSQGWFRVETAALHLVLAGLILLLPRTRIAPQPG